MKAKTKRTLSAWLLLSVFVSMMLVTDLHRHQPVAATTTDCVDCAHHVHHGHLTSASTSLHECLLCQFIGFSYLAAATLIIALPFCTTPATVFTQASFCSQNVGNRQSTRAPPYVLKD